MSPPPTPGFSRADRFSVSASVRARQLDDELVLLDLQEGEYFSLNATGAAVWSAIARGESLGGVDRAVAAAWPVEAEERWRLLTSLIEDLLIRGLVERAG